MASKRKGPYKTWMDPSSKKPIPESTSNYIKKKKIKNLSLVRFLQWLILTRTHKNLYFHNFSIFQFYSNDSSDEDLTDPAGSPRHEEPEPTVDNIHSILNDTPYSFLPNENVQGVENNAHVLSRSSFSTTLPDYEKDKEEDRDWISVSLKFFVTVVA